MPKRVRVIQTHEGAPHKHLAPARPSVNGKPSLRPVADQLTTGPTPAAVEALTEEAGRTEAANALRLAERFGDGLRYAVEWKRWIVWDGRRWARDEGGIAVQGKAADVAADLWRRIADAKPNDWLRKQMASFATSSNAARGVKNMVTLARSMLPIDVARLDADPWLLNVANGTLDLRTGRLRPPRRRDYLTKLCPTAYDPDAECPTWEAFLSRVFDGDGELIGYLQRLLGYGVTGDVREQVLPVLWGEGSNGKSTLVGAVLHALGGDYGGAAPRSLFTAGRAERHPTELMTLKGRRLLAAQETDAGARLNEALIKHLTGGDAVTGRRMYEDFSSFEPTHKLLLSTNHKPEVRGADHAIWRRLKLIPFAVRFAGERIDREMPRRLQAEAEGILAWIVRGCLAWQRGGLAEPGSVRAATRAYAAEQDLVGRFLADRCEVGEGPAVEAGPLYEAFKRAAPGSEVTMTAFGTELSRRGFVSGRLSRGPNKGRRTWEGLRLAGEEAATRPKPEAKRATSQLADYLEQQMEQAERGE